MANFGSLTACSGIPRSALVLLAILAGARICPGQVTMNHQDRFVETSAEADVVGAAADSETERVEAAGFGLFQDDALAGAVSNNGLDLAQALSTAWQGSLIQNLSVEMSGETHVFADVNNGPSFGSANGTAVSSLSYTFTLATATDYMALARVARFGPVSDASVLLRDAAMTPIFAIGEASGYTSNFLNASGTLAAGTYTLEVFADTEHTYLGSLFPTSAGAELDLLFALDAFAPGEVVNSEFNDVPGSSQIFGWTVSGPGQASIASAGGDNALLLESGSPVHIVQDVDTFDQAFLLAFDYQFLDTAGTLQVYLDSELLTELNAPGTLAGVMQTQIVEVTLASLFDLDNGALQFTFDGPAPGLRMYLDGVSMWAVPEPGTGLAVLAFVGLFLRRHRRCKPGNRVVADGYSKAASRAQLVDSIPDARKGRRYSLRMPCIRIASVLIAILSASDTIRADIVVGVDNNNGYLINIDTTTGAGVIRAPLESDLFFRGLTCDPINSRAIATTSSAGLYEVNLNTGVTNLVGSYGGIYNMYGITFDAGSETLYAAHNTTHLATINGRTGIASLVGSFQNGSRVRALAHDSGLDILYGAALVSGQPESILYTIDRGTGLATALGSIPWQIYNLAYDPRSDQLFGMTVDYELLAIDPISVSATFLGPTGYETYTFAAIPEPAMASIALVLLLAGELFVDTHARRGRK